MAELAQYVSVQALAGALIHFLWQGALIALAAAALMRGAGTAGARYAIGIIALVALVAAPAVTFVTLLDSGAGRTASSFLARPVAAVAPVSAIAGSGTAESSTGRSAAEAGLWSAAGVLAWLAGIVVLSVRLAGGWLVARRMATRAVRPAADHVQALAAGLAERLALKRAVQVLESSAVAVPVLVGWLRPTVVFPIAALAGLSPAQIEALLAHELAHVRRHDYLVNLLQSFVEVVLFYHPAVWWLSRRVRIERELCCDDEAVGVCDRLIYATALTDLAAMRSPKVALAATGGDLLARVRRILGREENSMSIRLRWAPAVVVATAILVAVPVLIASVRTTLPSATPASQASPGDSQQASPDVAEPVTLETGQAQRQVAQELEQRRATLDAMRRVGPDRPYTERLESALQEQQSVERLEQSRRETEEKRRAAELEAAARSYERMRKLFEVGLVTQAQLAEAETALALLQAGKDQKRAQEIEVDAFKQRLEDIRRRVEIGVLSRDEQARVENELAALQARARERGEMTAQLSERLREFERSRQLFEQGLVSRGQVVEAEKLLRELEQKQKDKPRIDSEDLARKLKDVLNQLEKAKVDEPRKRESEARELAARDFEPVASRPIVAGDTLFIAIEGESLLPTIYRIEDNGSIRIPLLGSFKVVGQTPGQVRESIGKRLMEAKLGSPSKVRVELRRPRGER